MTPPTRQLPLRTFRRLVQLTSLASVALVAAGLFLFVSGQWAWALLVVLAGILLVLPPQLYRIQPEAGSEHVLLLVTKRECPLCDEARLLLPQLLEGTPFRVEEADLDQDRFLRRHFRHDVPVLLWQGEVLAKLRFDPTTLRAKLLGLLDASQAQAPSAGRTGQQST